jgi:molybdopterin-guanine dinucleotide biosynthesis protein B
MSVKRVRALTVRISGSGRNVGKTTLSTRLISWLSGRGYRVSAVKRTHHPIPSDEAGSDTDLMAQAGAVRIAFAGPDGILERSGSAPLDEILARLGDDADVVIVEGYRDEELDLQFHLAGPPPAQVEVTTSDRTSIAAASADDVDLLGQLIERALAGE